MGLPKMWCGKRGFLGSRLIFGSESSLHANNRIDKKRGWRIYASPFCRLVPGVGVEPTRAKAHGILSYTSLFVNAFV